MLKIVSIRVSRLKEYGALLIPEGRDNLPVRVYVGGFRIDIIVNSVKLLVDNMNDDTFIFAFPALRGQSLSITINNNKYVSPTNLLIIPSGDKVLLAPLTFYRSSSQRNNNPVSPD